MTSHCTDGVRRAGLGCCHALNLLPVGQLDGGHISYALVPAARQWMTCPWLAVAVTSFVSSSWIVVAVLLLVMLFLLGPGIRRVDRRPDPLRPVR